MMHRCFAAGLFLLLFLAGCSGAREAAAPAPTLVGTWDYVMTSESQGTLTGQMTFSEAEDGRYNARITVSEMGIDEQTVLESVEIEGSTFTMSGNAGGAQFVLTGTIDGDTMIGQNDVAGVDVFDIEATRVGAM